MKKYIITIIILIAIAAAGFFAYRYFPQKTKNIKTQEVLSPEMRTSESAQITIKNFSFSPSTITIKNGDSVKWINEDSTPHTATSNPHPFHADLPELSSGPLQKGGEYTFIFTKTGTFGYHCHIHPSMLGTVIVTE